MTNDISNVMPPEMVLWSNCTFLLRHYNLNGAASINISAEVSNFYAATSQILTTFRLSGI